MKLALLTDTHFGVHKNSEVFLESQLRFFREEFFPYLDSNKITTIYFLGDLFDNRTNINVRTMNAVYDLMKEINSKYTFHLILGNHDLFFNSSNDVHSSKMFSEFKNIKIYEKQHSEPFNHTEFFPWNTIKDSKPEELELGSLAFGHFDICSFNMNKFKTTEVGLNPKLFSTFKLVFSGHFHTRSIRKIENTEFVYVGSPYQLTRIDTGEERGFCILDTETFTYEFINTTKTIKYVKLNFPETITEEMIKGNIVDVHVKYDSTYDDNDLKKYIEKIVSFNPTGEVTTKIDNSVLDSIEITEKMTSVEGLIEEYIKQLEIGDKDEIRKIIYELFDETKETNV